jgi:hypothetical protein
MFSNSAQLAMLLFWSRRSLGRKMVRSVFDLVDSTTSLGDGLLVGCYVSYSFYMQYLVIIVVIPGLIAVCGVVADRLIVHKYRTLKMESVDKASRPRASLRSFLLLLFTFHFVRFVRTLCDSFMCLAAPSQHRLLLVDQSLSCEETWWRIIVGVSSVGLMIVCIVPLVLARHFRRLQYRNRLSRRRERLVFGAFYLVFRESVNV